jgi:DNA-directed RNA polymerase subunit RPC12/RpoP
MVMNIRIVVYCGKCKGEMLGGWWETFISRDSKVYAESVYECTTCGNIVEVRVYEHGE